MIYTRRDMGKIALAGFPLTKAWAAAKPNSKFGGVQIGVMTYSFRDLPGSAEETLKYCLDCGTSGIELLNGPAENYAGIPSQGGRGGGPGARAGGARGGRAPLTPEQQEAQRKAPEVIRNWRLSVSMDKYKALRKMYNDAGVKIYAFKLPSTMAMSDEEYAYIWNVAETLGANHVPWNLPGDDKLVQRLADYAAKRKLRIAFHTDGHGGSARFDKVLSASKYTALNLDVGNYFGANGESPVPVVEKYHDRIASLHIKDCKGPKSGGEGVPWGQGETPLREVLQLMKRKKYKFPASIEYEYDTPEGSDVLTEIKKCMEYCKKALA